jgi:hypothetical protein
MLFLSYYLAAIGAFYLSKLFAKYNVPAFFGGFIFAFSPFHLTHLLYHMHVATIQYIPFFLICFFCFMESRKIIFLAGSILFYWLSALSCMYYLIFIGYFLGFYYCYKAISQRKLLIKECLVPIVFIVIGTVLLLSPLFIPLVLMSAKDHRVYLNGKSYFTCVADLAGFFTFDPYHLLSGLTQPVWSRFRGNIWEVTVYLGSINILLFLWAFFNRICWKIKGMNFLLWGMITFMILASGPYLYVLGTKIIPLPTYVLGIMPFFKHVRAPARAVVFVYLFLGVGVGLAIEAIYNQYFMRKKILYSIFIGIIFTLIFLDYYPTRLESTRVTCPPAYGVITDDKNSNFGILDLPKGYSAGNTYMMYQAACHGRPIVVATAPVTYRDSLNKRIGQDDIELLKKEFIENNVKYIVLHKNLKYDKMRAEDIDQYVKSFHVVYTDKDNIVLQVF